MHKIHIIEMIETDAHWRAVGHENVPVETAQKVKPGNRLLVDSDGFAFVYIIEDDTDFHHIVFHQEMWETVNQAYKSKKPIWLELGENQGLELTGFHEEFDFLLENIEGNGNYGVDFEQAVSTAFHLNETN